MTELEKPREWRWEGRVALGLLLLAMAIYGWRVFNHEVPTFYGLADEHGYMTTAKNLAEYGSFVRRQEDPYAFVGETMMQSPRYPRDYYLRQPIGYPLLCAAAYWLGGIDGPFAVTGLMGLFLLGGVYWVGKELGSALLGAIGALIIAAHPLILYYTLMALSHVPDMAVATWAVAFALMWRRERLAWQAALTGILLGGAVLIRYMNLLMILPLGVIVIESFQSQPRGTWRDVAIAGGCFVVLLIPLALYQAAAFGSPLRTGYSAGGNGTSFSVPWLVAHAPAMGAILISPGMGLSVLLASVAIGAVVFMGKQRFVLAMLSAWAVPPLLLYTAYYGMPERNAVLYARFALSSFVPLILLGVMWPAWLGSRRMAGIVVAGVLALGAIGWSQADAAMASTLDNLENQKLFMFSVRQLVAKNVPKGAVIVADTVTYYYLDYAGDYTIYSPELFWSRGVANRLADRDRTPHELDPARTRQIATLLGRKSDAELAAILRDRILHYDQSGVPVYLVTMVDSAPMWQKALGIPLEPIDASTMMVGLYRFHVSPVTPAASQAVTQ